MKILLLGEYSRLHNSLKEGVLISNGIWRELKNFSSGAVCLVVASAVFEEDDYIRTFDKFMHSKN